MGALRTPSLAGWLAGRLASRLAGRLTGWLAGGIQDCLENPILVTGQNHCGNYLILWGNVKVFGSGAGGALRTSALAGWLADWTAGWLEAGYHNQRWEWKADRPELSDMEVNFKKFKVSLQKN